MRTFGSLGRLRKASVEELAAVPGITDDLAAVIHAHLSAETVTPAVNVTTGEVIEDDGAGRPT